MMRPLISALLILLASCINMNDPESQARYIECRNGFDKTLVKLFPDRLPNEMLAFGFSVPYNDRPGSLHLTLRYLTFSNYLDAKNNFVSKAMHRTKADNKCLAVIEALEENKHEPCDDFLPVASASIYTSDEHPQQLIDKDNEVFIIEFAPGDFIKDHERQPGSHLPEKWSYGYSSGVTTNDQEKTIVIWMTVW
jgi:hypothetical protein